MTGATIVTMPRFDLERFLRMIEEYRITRAFVVPPIVVALAKHPLVERLRPLAACEMVISGAAPLDAELEELCAARIGTRVQQGYGLTEASPVTHCTPLWEPHVGGIDRRAPAQHRGAHHRRRPAATTPRRASPASSGCAGRR